MKRSLVCFALSVNTAGMHFLTEMKKYSEISRRNSNMSTCCIWKPYTCFIAPIYDLYDIESWRSWDRFSSAQDARWHLLLLRNRADMEYLSSFDKCQHKQSNRRKKRLTFSHYAIFIRKRHTSFFIPEVMEREKTEERKNEHVFHVKAAETELMVVWNGLSKMSYPTVMSCLFMYFPLLFHTFYPIDRYYLELML